MVVLPDRIANSSSRNAVNFLSARTTKRFPSSRCASATKIVRPLESIALDAAPTPTGFAQDCERFVCQHGNRFVRSLLTASSVIPVMPVSMLMVPNPGCRNEWPVHCDGGIHYVRPFNFGAWLAVVMAFATAPHIPHKKKKPAVQHH
jgi:hypothetical protein